MDVLFQEALAVVAGDHRIGLALLYPPQSDKGPNRVALVLSKQTVAQQNLAKELGLDALQVAKG